MVWLDPAIKWRSFSQSMKSCTLVWTLDLIRLAHFKTWHELALIRCLPRNVTMKCHYRFHPNHHNSFTPKIKSSWSCHKTTIHVFLIAPSIVRSSSSSQMFGLGYCLGQVFTPLLSTPVNDHRITQVEVDWMSGMKGVPCALTYVLGFLMPFLDSYCKEIDIS